MVGGPVTYNTFFKDIPHTHIIRILHICKYKNISSGEYIYFNNQIADKGTLYSYSVPHH